MQLEATSVYLISRFSFLQNLYLHDKHKACYTGLCKRRKPLKNKPLEDTFLKRKDLWILLAAVGLAGLLMLAATLLPKISSKQAGGQLNTATETITDVKATENISVATAVPDETLSPQSDKQNTQNTLLTPDPENKQPPALIPANAYLSVQIGQVVYDPIPLLGDDEISVKQADGKLNVIGITDSSIFMKSATCDNQACIKQGTVTLDNIEERVLQNMIICLPNEVVLSLLTPQEAQLEWDSLYEEKPEK